MIKRFLLFFIGMILLNLLLTYLSEGQIALNQLFWFNYHFIPFWAVWMTEKRSLKSITIDYGIRFNKQVFGTVFRAGLVIIVLYPLLVGGGNYLTGNVLGWTGTLTDFFSLEGINTVGDLFLYLSKNILFALLLGVSSNFFSSLLGEVAWRGFLEKHVQTSPIKKGLLIALIWSSYMTVYQVYNMIYYHSTEIDYLRFGRNYLYFFILSLFLRHLRMKSGGIIAPALIYGIIQSFVFSISGNNALWWGSSRGVLIQMTLLLITGVVVYWNKNKSSQEKVI